MTRSEFYAARSSARYALSLAFKAFMKGQDNHRDMYKMAYASVPECVAYSLKVRRKPVSNKTALYLVNFYNRDFFDFVAD